MCVMRQGNEVFLHTAFEDPLGSDRSLQNKTKKEVTFQLKLLNTDDSSTLTARPHSNCLTEMRSISEVANYALLRLKKG